MVGVHELDEVHEVYELGDVHELYDVVLVQGSLMVVVVHDVAS